MGSPNSIRIIHLLTVLWMTVTEPCYLRGRDAIAVKNSHFHTPMNPGALTFVYYTPAQITSAT